MSKYSAADNSRVIGEQVKRIHGAIHDGTLDKATIDDALGKLSNLASDNAESHPAGGLGGNSVDQNRAVPTPHRGEPSDNRGDMVNQNLADPNRATLGRHAGEPTEQYPLNPPAGSHANRVDNRGNPVSPAHAGDPKEAQAKIDTRRNPV